MSLTLRDGPGSALPKPPWCQGINGNSATRHPSCEPKPGTAQRASGILSRVIDPMAGETTPSPAKGGMEATDNGGGRIKRAWPSPVTPSLSHSLLLLPPTATASAFTGFLCSGTPRHAFAGHRAPGTAGAPGRAVPTAAGRARSRSPRPAGDSRGAVLCRAVPCRALPCPLLSFRGASPPSAPRTATSVQLQYNTYSPAEPSQAVPCRAPPG